jgi:serine O-acetyltransferase
MTPVKTYSDVELSKPMPVEEVWANEVAKTWWTIRQDAFLMMQNEPLLRKMVQEEVLAQGSFEEMLANRVSKSLASSIIARIELSEICKEALFSNPEIAFAASKDIHAALKCDPACDSALQPLLFFKGYLSLQCHRIAHEYWTGGRKDISRFIQARTSEAFGVDIHPGATIGHGVMLDHANSIVIGETAVVGNYVTVLHSVTLGSTGSVGGDRHPKIGDNVLLGAGAIVLGNIHVGDNAKVAAGSVVVKHVPSGRTVAGVPARIVSDDRGSQ